MKKHQHTENTGMAKIDIDAVVKELIDQQKEFKRKLVLWTIISKFMEWNDLKKAALTYDQIEALEILADAYDVFVEY